jgi:hypothetical protein
MRRAVSLSGAIVALSCIVLILILVPAGAQTNGARNEGGGIPPGTPAKGVDTRDNNRPPDVILVAADGCRVSPGASITLEDGDGTQATFTDGEKGITISDQNGRPKIEGPPADFVGDDSHVTFPSDDTSFDTDKDYSVVSSTGITGCRGGVASPAQDQYGDVNDPKGVVADTVTGKKMPPTGGPPLIVVGVLALLSAAVVVGRGILRP